MADDPHDRPTPRPPRPSARRIFAAPSDSPRLKEAQERILNGLESGVLNLVKRFFADAREIVHLALLHALHDTYNEAIARGKRQAVIVYESYVEVLERMYVDLLTARDPRVEIERPQVSMADLQGAVAARGVELTGPELASLCGELKILLTEYGEDE